MQDRDLHFNDLPQDGCTINDWIDGVRNESNFQRIPLVDFYIFRLRSGRQSASRYSGFMALGGMIRRGRGSTRRKSSVMITNQIMAGYRSLLLSAMPVNYERSFFARPPISERRPARTQGSSGSGEKN